MLKIGDEVYIHGYIDEIRKDTVIIRNNGGYFGTIPSEVITGELTSAQPEQRWIPCKRLPNKEGKYLVTDTGTVDVDIFTHSENGTPIWFLSDNVTAWMQMPEPYKEGKQDG